LPIYTTIEISKIDIVTNINMDTLLTML